MEDNTDEEPISSSPNTPSIDPAEEIVSTNDIDIINPDQETENMEVHHHPQLHHTPKPWKEYFLEFIMIFIAVTLGFFAESYREHLVNKGKEKEIITALYNDLKNDTSNLNIIIYRYMPEHLAWEDSAEKYITSLPIYGNERKLAKALVNATNWNFYSPPQVSFDVIKGSGNFNLIRKEKIKEDIIDLNSLINTYITYSQFVLTTEHSIDTATAGIIPRRDLRLIIAKVYEKTNAQFGSITDSDMPPMDSLKTYDKAHFVNYLNKLDQMDYLLNDLLGLYQKVLKEETNLLGSLNKEYHLDH